MFRNKDSVGIKALYTFALFILQFTFFNQVSFGILEVLVLEVFDEKYC